eukprot:SAG31_NODE_2812_length_5052_cov_2.155663_2_plen_432_part_00
MEARHFHSLRYGTLGCWKLKCSCVPWGHVDVSITSEAITINQRRSPLDVDGCGKKTISTYNIADCKWLHVSRNAVPVRQLLWYTLEAILVFFFAGAIFVLGWKWISSAAAVAGLLWLTGRVTIFLSVRHSLAKTYASGLENASTGNYRGEFEVPEGDCIRLVSAYLGATLSSRVQNRSLNDDPSLRFDDLMVAIPEQDPQAQAKNDTRTMLCCSARSSHSHTIAEQRDNCSSTAQNSSSVPASTAFPSPATDVRRFVTERPPLYILDSCLRLRAPHTLIVGDKFFVIMRQAETTLPCCNKLSDSDYLAGLTPHITYVHAHKSGRQMATLLSYLKTALLISLLIAALISTLFNICVDKDTCADQNLMRQVAQLPPYSQPSNSDCKNPFDYSVVEKFHNKELADTCGDGLCNVREKYAYTGAAVLTMHVLALS